LAPIGRQLKVVIEVGFRVTGKLNCLEEIKNLKNQGYSTNGLLEKRVITLYNNRPYKLVRIVEDKHPDWTCIQKGGKTMSIA
jgi:hypothetical protein